MILYINFVQNVLFPGNSLLWKKQNGNCLFCTKMLIFFQNFLFLKMVNFRNIIVLKSKIFLWIRHIIMLEVLTFRYEIKLKQ